MTLDRPDKARVTRHGGFADIEAVFDGKTLTLLGKNTNLYAQVDVPGTIDHLVDELRDNITDPSLARICFCRTSMSSWWLWLRM